MHFKRSKASVHAFNVRILSFHKVSLVHGVPTGNNTWTFQGIAEGIDGLPDLKAGFFDEAAFLCGHDLILMDMENFL